MAQKQPFQNPITPGLNHRFVLRDPSKSSATDDGNYGECSLNDLALAIGINPSDNTAPVIAIGSAFAVPENSLFRTQLVANKPNVVWSLVPGLNDDYAAFLIDGDILQFIPALNVDFENPADRDMNNSYICTVKCATAGNLSQFVTKQVTVTVLDAQELFAPTNIAPPVITGTPQQGQTLVVTSGTWSDTPSAYGYQWRRNGIPIAGAVQPTYALTPEDVGAVLTVIVTAQNAAGTGSESSGETGTVSPAAPVFTSRPIITGTVQVGKVLTASNGTWDNNPTSFARQWKRNGTNIADATGTTYTLVAADLNAAITCTVTATNAGGSTSRTSDPTAPVLAAGSALSISGSPVTSATIGSAYGGFSVAAAGGQGPYKYSVVSNPLPPGISLNVDTGAVSGSATGSAQNYANIIIRATDAAGATADLPAFSINVAAAVVPLAISGTPGNATVGSAYTFTPAVTGGNGSTKGFTFEGTLPPGMNFSSTTGAITGTPTTAGTYDTVKITVTDTSGSAILGPITIPVASSAAFLLDTLDQKPEFWISLRRSAANMGSGNYVRIRRADGLEAEFGWDAANILDFDAVLNFTGRVTASEGYIVSVKDQSGNGKDLTFPSGAQPKIVSAGAIVLKNNRAIMPIPGVAHSSPSIDIDPGNTTMSYRIVADHRSSGNGDLVRGTVAGAGHVRFNGTHFVQTLKQGGSVLNTAAAALAAGTLGYIAVDFDAAGTTIVVDGGAPATSTTAPALVQGGKLQIGGSTTSVNGIAAIGRFATKPSASDDAKMLASTRSYYGTAGA
jgi:hypothetical protein